MHVLVFYSFYGWIIFHSMHIQHCFFIHPLMDIWIIFTFCLLWIVSLLSSYIYIIPTNFKINTALWVRNLKWINRATFLLETPVENLFTYLFKLLQAAHIPWFKALFLHLQSEKCWAETSRCDLSGSLFCFPLPLMKTLVITVGSPE